MYISHASVEHFRALNEVSIPLSKFSVVIGENDVGKTSFLYALNLFFNSKKIADPQDFFSQDVKTNISITLTFSELSDDASLDAIRCQDSTVTIRKTFAFNETPAAVAILDGGVTKKVGDKLLKEFFSERSFDFIPVRRDLSVQFSMNKTALLGRTLREKMHQVLKEDAGKSVLPQIEKILKDSVEEPRARLELFLQQQMRNADLKLKFDDLTVDPTEGVSFEANLSDDKVQGIPIGNRGAGTQNNLIIALFRLVADLDVGKNLIFAMEEPENSLHPKAQRQLLAVLQEISADSQVIVTTHSPVFLDRTQLDSNIVLTRTPKGTTIAKTFRKEMLEELRKNLGIRVSDTLLKGGGNCAILVEGNTEEDGFPVFMEMLGLSDFQLGTTILNMGGTTKTKRGSRYENTARLLLAYDIPCVAVLDKDAHQLAEELDGSRTASDGLPNLKRVFCLQEGSIEDYYPLEVIAAVINQDFSPTNEVTAADFDSSKHGEERVKNILKVMYERGCGEPGSYLKRRIGLTGTRLMKDQGMSVHSDIKEIFDEVVRVVAESE